jgi:hypothetical protein
MKSVIVLLTKLMSIAMVTVLLLSVGVEPASAAGFPKPLPCRSGFITFPWAPRFINSTYPQPWTVGRGFLFAAGVRGLESLRLRHTDLGE